MTDMNAKERQNFFELLHELNTARAAGEDCALYVDEFEAIARHTEQPALRRRAQAIVDDARKQREANLANA